jgi:ribosomal protein S18 acetylase RimI-like enzyme
LYHIRDYKQDDDEKIFLIFKEMQKYYPKILGWSEKAIDRIKTKKSICKIASYNQKPIGIALLTEKEKGVFKLNTFYIIEAHQKEAIGQNLLGEIIRQVISFQARHLYVTMNNDLFDILVPFFEKYGFHIEGIAPDRYIEGKFEIVMGKSFFYGNISEEHFYDFIKQNLFLNRGYSIIKEKDSEMLVSPCVDILGFYNKSSKKDTHVIISTKLNQIKEINNKPFEECYENILISFYGQQFNEKSKFDKLLDAYDVENIFYPIELNFLSNKQKDFIVPLQTSWRNINLPPSSNIMPCQFQNRLVKLIPRHHQFSRKYFRRGSHLLLFDNEKNCFFGTMKLIGFKEGSPKELVDFYSKQNSITMDELNNFAGPHIYDEPEKVTVLEVDWYRKFKRSISINEITGINKERIKKELSNSLYAISHNKYDEIVKMTCYE